MLPSGDESGPPAWQRRGWVPGWMAASIRKGRSLHPCIAQVLVIFGRGHKLAEAASKTATAVPTGVRFLRSKSCAYGMLLPPGRTHFVFARSPYI